MMIMSNFCPCQIQAILPTTGDELSYSQCCQPFHTQQDTPHTAEQLMRSRYSAYVLGLIDYIVHTTVPSQQTGLDRFALQQWSRETAWQGLQVITTQNMDKSHDKVEFKAYFLHENQQQAHHEISYFVKIQQKWYFLDPTVPIALSMKQPCLCGSEKKFKACCAKYLL